MKQKKKYTVHISRHGILDTDIYAESREEAMEKAETILENIFPEEVDYAVNWDDELRITDAYSK